MKRIQEVPDYLFNQVKEMMIEDDSFSPDPSFDSIFNMTLKVKERMEDCNMTLRQAFFDIMY